MKIVLFVFALSFLTFGCKKDEVPGQAGSSTVAEDTITRTRPPEPPGDLMVPPHARRAVASAPDRALLRDHASAAKIYLNLPDSAMPSPIPPAVRPFKNLKLKHDEGNSVFYNFETADGRPGDMVLVKHGLGSDTIWLPLHILPK